MSESGVYLTEKTERNLVFRQTDVVHKFELIHNNLN